MEAVSNNLVEKADQVLKQAFPGVTIEWDPVEPNERISGWIYWDGFEGVDNLDRQIAVSNALRAGLIPEEWKQISAVFAMTPHEISVIRSDNIDN